MRGRGLQQWGEVLLCVHSDQRQQSVIRAWIPDIWKRGSFFAYPGCCKLCLSCSRNMCTAACLSHGWWWRMGSCYATESWNWPKLTIIYHPAFLWKFQAFNKIWSSKVIISKRLCQCNCGLCGETDCWGFLLCHLPRIFSNFLIFKLAYICRHNKCYRRCSTGLKATETSSFRF